MGRPDRVYDIGAEGVSRNCQRRANRVFVEARMCFKNLWNGFPGSQFLKNQFNGNARASDYGLAHHHIWVGNNHLGVLAHVCLSKPAYCFAIGMSFEWCGFV